MSSLTLQDFIDEGHDHFPHSQMMPLSYLHGLLFNRHFELRVELTDSSSNDYYDSYTSIMLSSPDYVINLGLKKGSSAALSSFNLASTISGAMFKVATSPCYAAHNTGSWYSGSCAGFALLGAQASMFYGPLSGTLVKTKLLIRDTHCVAWSLISGLYSCTQCESGYLPNALGVCISCTD